MKNKSFLNKFEELKPKVPMQLDVERKLLPRLKFMGYVMYTLAVASLCFAIFIGKNEGKGTELLQEGIQYAAASLNLDSDEELFEFNADEVLNFYIVSLIFATVGSACFLIAKKKKKTLFEQEQTSTLSEDV